MQTTATIRKAQIIFAAMFAMVLVALVLLARGGAEPVYHGHPISYWIEPWQHHGTEPEENIAAAFSEMDERAVRWLAGQLDWRPSRLKATLNNLVARVISAKFFNDAPDRREVGAMGLVRLGPRAVSAICALEAVMQDTAEPRANSARAAALGALIRIRGEPLEPHLERLRDPSAPDWQMYARVMLHLGTNAAPAVPYLVNALEKPVHEEIVLTAVHALAAIHSRPHLTVPALARQLDNTNTLVRRTAIRGLSFFGAGAKPAWPALTPRLQDPHVMVRIAATNALRQIDAEAARQLGVN
jgi:HEAT repeat protein